MCVICVCVPGSIFISIHTPLNGYTFLSHYQSLSLSVFLFFGFCVEFFGSFSISLTSCQVPYSILYVYTMTNEIRLAWRVMMQCSTAQKTTHTHKKGKRLFAHYFSECIKGYASLHTFWEIILPVIIHHHHKRMNSTLFSVLLFCRSGCAGEWGP